MERAAAGTVRQHPFGGPHSTDQIPLYDGLTPKFDNVTAADLPTFFKPNIFGLGGQTPERVETPPGAPGCGSSATASASRTSSARLAPT